MLNWDELSKNEQEQAKQSYLSIMEDAAECGDENDKIFYNEILQDEKLLTDMVKRCSFVRDIDNYIFVNV